jgi:hypothetical protein
MPRSPAIALKRSIAVTVSICSMCRQRRARCHQPPHTAPEGGSMGRQVMQGHISHTLKFWTGGLRGRSRIQPRRRKSGSWRRRRARCRALLRDYRGDARPDLLLAQMSPQISSTTATEMASDNANAKPNAITSCTMTFMISPLQRSTRRRRGARSRVRRPGRAGLPPALQALARCDMQPGRAADPSPPGVGINASEEPCVEAQADRGRARVVVRQGGGSPSGAR